MPRLSVIMPTKNRAHIISNAIRSILDQTFNDWELIVVDDHGKDNTEEIVKKFHSPKIKYFYLSQDYGPGPARDFGFKKAQSEIVVLADSDDFNYPNRLEWTWHAFHKHPLVDMVYGLAAREESNGEKIMRPSHFFDPELLKKYNYIAQPTVAFKKNKYLETPGYDKNLRTSEDYDLWLSFLEKNAQFYFVDQPLVLQKIHPESTMLGVPVEKRKANLAYVRKKHNLAIPRYEDVKKLVQNKDLLDFISTEKAINFWFSA